jgi:hypothetical protein
MRHSVLHKAPPAEIMRLIRSQNAGLYNFFGFDSLLARSPALNEQCAKASPAPSPGLSHMPSASDAERSYHLSIPLHVTNALHPHETTTNINLSKMSEITLRLAILKEEVRKPTKSVGFRHFWSILALPCLPFCGGNAPEAAFYELLRFEFTNV